MVMTSQLKHTSSQTARSGAIHALRTLSISTSVYSSTCGFVDRSSGDEEALLELQIRNVPGELYD
jgi:hypothetical protein